MATSGSSPLARGTRPSPSAGGRPGAVHPRWRGEHRTSGIAVTHRRGSSPLARGTPERVLIGRNLGRFIPAGAGNTEASNGAALRASVHPRWRGEHYRLSDDRNAVCGSSPLARGTPPAAGEKQTGQRFIPAGAGNTRARPQAPRQPPVHPRWRGEHDKIPPLIIKGSGSSPLARGTPAKGCESAAQFRFIPAGAGNTAPRASRRG